MIHKTTIYENQTGILVKDGKIVRKLGPGVYRHLDFARPEYVIYSKNPQSYLVPNACRSKDNANFVIDVPTMITIEDTRVYYLSGVSFYEEVARVCKKYTKELVEKITLSEALAEPLELDVVAINKELARCGLSVSIEGSVEIRLPRNLQNSVDAQEVARQKAKAEMEEARGRTAVLRHYANTAKITKENPDILRLLLGQKAKSINVAFDAHR